MNTTHFITYQKEYKIIILRSWLYSVVVITFGFDPNNPGSNPGTTLIFLHLATIINIP